MLLSIEIHEELVAEPELLRCPIIFHSLALAILLWSISIRKIFGRRWMNLSLRTTNCLILIAADDRYSRGKTSR